MEAAEGPPPGPDGPGDFEKLARFLDGLASPVRLELLHLLRYPRSVADIQLRASEGPGLTPARNLTREGVRKHLAKLEDLGLVTSRRVRRRGTYTKENVVNDQMLYALVEELRRVTRVSPLVAVAPAATLTESHRAPASEKDGPRLILVHGAREGQAFPFDSRSLRPGRGWVLGRKRGLAVSLDYDPFVSQEHAEVLRKGTGFELLDLRTNKNGTDLNWHRLPRGGAAPLRTGDIVGVGRSLLVFRET